MLRARRVILAAGVLGTLELLFRARDRDRTLPNVSPRLGQVVRTNSEAITAILSRDRDADLSRGPAISSHFYPDPITRIFQNRLADNENFLRFHYGPLIDGERPGAQGAQDDRVDARPPRAHASGVGRAELHQARLGAGDDAATRQRARVPLRAPADRAVARGAALRRRCRASRRRPTCRSPTGPRARSREASGGEPLNMLIESVANKSTTAHILGGAVIGASAAQGVIDTRHELFGHPGLYVVDASAIPVNLGVNPSLTITALAERFASLIPPAAADHAASAQTRQGQSLPQTRPPTRERAVTVPGDGRRGVRCGGEQPMTAPASRSFTMPAVLASAPPSAIACPDKTGLGEAVATVAGSRRSWASTPSPSGPSCLSA